MNPINSNKFGEFECSNIKKKKYTKIILKNILFT